MRKFSFVVRFVPGGEGRGGEGSLVSSTDEREASIWQDDDGS